jgi:hypothetical protein
MIFLYYVISFVFTDIPSLWLLKGRSWQYRKKQKLFTKWKIIQTRDNNRDSAWKEMIFTLCLMNVVVEKNTYIVIKLHLMI